MMLPVLVMSVVRGGAGWCAAAMRWLHR